MLRSSPGRPHPSSVRDRPTSRLRSTRAAERRSGGSVGRPGDPQGTNAVSQAGPTSQAPAWHRTAMGVIRSLLFALSLIVFVALAFVANIGFWAISTALETDQFVAT